MPHRAWWRLAGSERTCRRMGTSNTSKDWPLAWKKTTQTHSFFIGVCLSKVNRFFSTCQVRVVRFYQGCCPPPRPPPPPPPPVSPVCIAGPQPGTFPAQCAPLDLNLGPSQLSGHRWTSTWDLPSSVCTAGPQPGTCPAQCALLNLNLGPSQLSVHRWTSTAR